MQDGCLSRDARTGQNRSPYLRFPRGRFRWISRVAIALLLGRLSLQAATLPVNFAETQYGSSLSGIPTAMEFAPDGRLFVCLQGGQLRIIENGILLATPFVTVATTANGERGLLGIAFDPNFASNQFVYVYYTVISAPIHNRVSRFTANGNVAVAGSETAILDLDNLSGATNHNGGGIHFGADNKLYVGVGENANTANAQTLANRLGKLLRINADGTIPADNPMTFPGIAGSSTGINRAIWAVGLRNPYTFAFQPGTGRLFINDVGQSTWEEIDDGIVGSNYGWSICEGFCSPPNVNYRDPLFQYGHGTSGTTGCAIVGGAFYNPIINQFPAGYAGKFFFSDLCSGWIRFMDPSTNTASAFATGISTPVDLKVGPDGSLYYLAQGGGGQVWRIQYTAAPTPTPIPTTKAINFSTRMRVETGDNGGIAGFIITGSSPKNILIRGIGPSLAAFGISDALADPTLDLRASDGSRIQANDNWRDTQEVEIKATGVPPQNDLEAAIVTTLPAESYTAILRGKAQGTGVALAEIYDLNQEVDSKLANLSTRAFVRTGDSIVIAGFLLGSNSGYDRVVVRGIGPSLTAAGVTNALADPTLELRDGDGALLAANNDWRDDPAQAAELTAAGLAPANNLESGIATMLPPGPYTVLLAGRNNGTGIGLVEVYDRGEP